MPASHRPKIFISATSGDLRSCRQLIKEALLTLGCVPVEQTNFPPAASTVREMLRRAISQCDAVIHVAGELYGAEPQERAASEPRASYTQWEYEIARELGKPVYVFVCGEQFPYDEHPAEDAERQALQQAHRARLQAGDHLFTPVESRDDLDRRVHALQARVEQLGHDLRRSRAWIGRGVGVGLLLAVLLGAGLWATSRRADKTEERVAQVESELDRQRRAIKVVADAYTQQQSQLAELKLSDAELFRRAVQAVAQREGVPPAELQTGIDLFVAAVRSDPGADFLDRALADFAEQNFASAAENAGKAGDEAHAQRLAAEELAARATEQAQSARDREREARSLEGQALYAEGRFEEAVAAFEAALKVTPRAEYPEKWAELQSRQGLALSDWASVSIGADIAARRDAAIDAYRAALEVYTREALPQYWAATQNNLAIALSNQAGASDGAERARLLAEAINAYRAALEVYTRAALPQDWAMTQNNLAIALSDQAGVAEGAERARLLTDAIDAYRAALEVRTREALPQNWAQTQDNLAIALWSLANAAEGAERARLLAEAIDAYRAALEVYTREALPQDWAGTQNNLAIALSDQAGAAEGAERARLLSEAVNAMRACLEVFTAELRPEYHAARLAGIAEIEAEIAELRGAENEGGESSGNGE